jgi:hypothetical protein
MHGNAVNNQKQATMIIDNALATAMHVTQSVVSRTLGNNSAGALTHVFESSFSSRSTSDTTAKTTICEQKSTMTKCKAKTLRL